MPRSPKPPSRRRSRTRRRAATAEAVLRHLNESLDEARNALKRLHKEVGAEDVSTELRELHKKMLRSVQEVRRQADKLERALPDPSAKRKSASRKSSKARPSSRSGLPGDPDEEY